VAAVLDRHDPKRLIDLGLQADPALTDEEFADAMRRLGRLDDEVFETLYGRTSKQNASRVGLASTAACSSDRWSLPRRGGTGTRRRRERSGRN
jgi:hypothetical protein